MAWQVDLRFQQRVVTEFLVAEKELVTYIHKRLKMYTISMLLKKIRVIYSDSQILHLRNPPPYEFGQNDWTALME
jgi:hypothetical protein